MIDSPEIIEIIKNAKTRGVAVTLIIDSKYKNNATVIDMEKAGITVHGRSYYNRMASSFIITDDKFLMVGSFDLDSADNDFEFSFVLRDTEILKMFNYEFSIMLNGTDSCSKDRDFDYTLGPFTATMSVNPLYDPIWYTFIFLSTGETKGIWKKSDSSLPITTYFMPYCQTDFSYGGWSDDDNDGTTEITDSDGSYDKSAIVLSYTDYSTNEKASVKCADVRNAILPYLKNAKKSVSIYALNFTDPVIADAIISNSPVNIETFLDYSFCRQKTSDYPVFKKLSEVSKTFRLVRRADSAKMKCGMIVIDDDTVIISSAGFSTNAFTSNDGYIIILNDAKLYIDNFTREISRMKSESCGWPDKDIFTGGYTVYENIETY
jgi:hypothetical protein